MSCHGGGGGSSSGGGREGLRNEPDRNMSSHGGIGDDDDKVELLELGSVYGTGSILLSLFQVLHWETLCL